MKNNHSTRSLTRAAVIAALYCLLTLIFQPISFGAVQFRIAEALTLLPILFPEAVSGLFAGCLLANMFSPGGFIWFDVVFGSLATLLAALFSRKLRRFPLCAAAMPVILNGLIVGPVVYLAYVRGDGAPIHWALMASTIATVALGEAAVCYLPGMMLIRMLKRLPIALERP